MSVAVVNGVKSKESGKNTFLCKDLLKEIGFAFSDFGGTRFSKKGSATNRGASGAWMRANGTSMKSMI